MAKVELRHLEKIYPGDIKAVSDVNVVVEVFQKGYRLGERVIRHSVVKVGTK